ncbi:MAG: ROK family protein [Planctomycetota bacterium]|nr:MAG: ROK family protein [Planctomycetota bacterium]
MYLGIEIGGTKLQVGVGTGTTPQLADLRRDTVDRGRGAAGILETIRRRVSELAARHLVTAIGIAFGGPIDPATGRIVKSHHVDGWDDFPLVQWCRNELELPAVIANDADLAGLAEARLGAGQGADIVFYVTVGTGIGGALVQHGKLYTGSCGIASELGHLRLGPEAESPADILETRAAGWGIAAQAKAVMRRLLPNRVPEHCLDDIPQPIRKSAGGRAPNRPLETSDASSALRLAAEEVWDLVDGDPSRIDVKLLGEAAARGNKFASGILADSVRHLGWGIAQVVTLVAPHRIIVGGGVSLLGEELFFAPLRQAVARYVFPPLADRYEILPAALGEEVVVHGALVLAADSFSQAAC